MSPLARLLPNKLRPFRRGPAARLGLAGLAAPLAFWLMPVAPLAGGVRIVETRRPIAGGEETTTTIRADENRAQVHTENGSGRYTVIFRRQMGVLWFVDHQQQFYREMSRETLAAMRDNLQRLLESMREAARRPPKKPSSQQEGKQPAQYPFFFDPAPGSPAHPPPTELKMSQPRRFPSRRSGPANRSIAGLVTGTRAMRMGKRFGTFALPGGRNWGFAALSSRSLMIWSNFGKTATCPAAISRWKLVQKIGKKRKPTLACRCREY